ncbi:MAG: hypothetical protein ACYDB7_00060 [Mycobacteriales bacterium]
MTTPFPTPSHLGQERAPAARWRRFWPSRLIRRSAGLVALVLTLVGMLTDPAWALAASSGGTSPAPSGSTSGGPLGPVSSLAANLTDDITAIAASVAVLFLAVNGVKYIVSGGNSARQTEAKTGMAAAAVGLVIALSASVLVALVLAALQ